jgi:type I restriction enzyme M protein
MSNQILQTQLWNIADALRGKMSADEYRDYMLGLIFFKYLSEKIQDRLSQDLSKDPYLVGKNIANYSQISSLKPEKYDEYVEYFRDYCLGNEGFGAELGYFLEPKHLFGNLIEQINAGQNIIPNLTNALLEVEKSSQNTQGEDTFADLFEDLDLDNSKLGKSGTEKNDLISKVLMSLAKIDFKLGDVDADVLGDAYEYLISNFASGAGKKSGEFYTPQQVSKLLVQIVDSQTASIQSVYDPTCGSGSLLLGMAKYRPNVNFYGQELIRTTFNLARMNMILHGIPFDRFDIKQDNTLTNPQHLNQRFDAIVANPPFSINWEPEKVSASEERFAKYGRLAPSSKADFAFIQHMIYHLADNGTMAIIMPHGVLFRGGAEGEIRKFIVANDNHLDAVIGLPANIFFGTSIPTCVLVFKKCRKHDQGVIFIDASKEFDKIKTSNFLSDVHIAKILETYKNRTEIEKYSKIVSLEQIKENDYNLNIPRYVDTFEAQDQIDIAQIAQELKELETNTKTTDQKITDFCKELGIDSPF